MSLEQWSDYQLPASERSISAEELALTSMESWPQAVVFLEPKDLKVVWMNPTATSCLALFSSLSSGRIQLNQRRQQKDLDQFLSRATSDAASWVLDGAEGEPAFVFRCRTIGDTRYKLVSVFTPDSPSTHLPDIGALLGLTPSESRVIQGLVNGSRADELALALGISLETVRTHIRRIYFKTSVNSREQLIAKVSAFRTP